MAIQLDGVENIPLDAFVKFITLYAPGCPAVLVRREALIAAIDLCSHAPVWRYQSQGIPITEGLQEMNIIFDFEADPIQLTSIAHDERQMTAVTQEMLDRQQTGWRQRIGSPQSYTLLNSYTKILLDAKPQGKNLGNLYFSYVLKPSREAENIPKFLFDDYQSEIAAGALKNILMIPAKNWTNPALAEVKEQQFVIGKKKARAEGNRSWTNTTLKARGARIVSSRKIRVR